MSANTASQRGAETLAPPHGGALCDRFEFPLPPWASEASSEGADDAEAAALPGEFPCGQPDSLPLVGPPAAEAAEPPPQQQRKQQPKPPKPKPDAAGGAGKAKQAAAAAGAAAPSPGADGGAAAVASAELSSNAALKAAPAKAAAAAAAEETAGERSQIDGDDGAEDAPGAGAPVRDSTTEYVRVVTFLSADIILAATNRGLVQALSLRAPSRPLAAAAPAAGQAVAAASEQEAAAGSWFHLYANPAPSPWMALASSAPSLEPAAAAVGRADWSALVLAGDMAGWAVLLRLDVSPVRANGAPRSANAPPFSCSHVLSIICFGRSRAAPC